MTEEFMHEWVKDTVRVEAAGNQIEFACKLSKEDSAVIKSAAKELRKFNKSMSAEECLRRTICLYAYSAIETFTIENFIATIEAIKFMTISDSE